MNHQVAMRHLDRPTHLLEEFEPVGDAEPLLIAIAIDRHPFDVLHYQVRQPVGRRSGVEQAGDVGMLDAGKNLPLGAEALQRLVAGHATAQDLDRHLPRELLVGTYRQVYAPGPAAADPAANLVGPQPLAGPIVALLALQHPGRGGRWRGLEEPLGLVVRGQ